MKKSDPAQNKENWDFKKVCKEVKNQKLFF